MGHGREERGDGVTAQFQTPKTIANETWEEPTERGQKVIWSKKGLRKKDNETLHERSRNKKILKKGGGPGGYSNAGQGTDV